MEDFKIISEDGFLQDDIISRLKYCGFNTVVNDDKWIISNDDFKDQYKEEQFVIFSINTFAKEMIDQYEDNERHLILKISADKLFTLRFSYRISRGVQLLYKVIDITNTVIIEKGLNNRVIVEEEYGGIFLLFDVFWQKWKLHKGFFHNE